MVKQELEVGTVVQIHPKTAGVFAGCFMVVTEPKSFGAQGYIQCPKGEVAYYRATWDDMEPVGQAVWVLG